MCRALTAVALAPVPVLFDALDADGNAFTGNTLAPDVTPVNNAILSGDFSLSKTGPGILIPTNANTYTGNTVINGGVL